MRKLHIDCPSGIAGDMFLASLIDLGAPLDWVCQGLNKLGLTESWSIRTERVLKQGISGLQLTVEMDGKVADLPESHGKGLSFHSHGGSEPAHVRDHGHGHGQGHDRDHDHTPDHGHDHIHGHSHDHSDSHDHSHGHHRHDHVHRPYRTIKEMIERADLPDRARSRALQVFARLAEAEGAVHGVPPDDVHFHEVGSTDAIIDVVGACLALEYLEVDAITASPLHVGRGFVRAAHGRIPVPAPATLLLLQGLEAYQTDVTGELVTPTGAAIVAALAESVGPMPPMRIERVGCGAGRMDLPIPNVVRSLLSTSRDVDGASGFDVVSDDVIELETNLDDLSPETLPFVFDRLFAAGAKDVWLHPATMKKGRPGWTLHVLAAPGTERRLAEIVFRETTTLGLRIRPARRWTLEREWVTVETAGGPIRVKVGKLSGAVANLAPEFEDAYKAAKASGLPLKELMHTANESAREELKKRQ